MYIEEIPSVNLYNHLILLIKKYIFVNKTKGELNFEGALRSIYTVKNIEKYIAKKNDKMLKFLKIWEPLLKNQED